MRIHVSIVGSACCVLPVTQRIRNECCSLYSCLEAHSSIHSSEAALGKERCKGLSGVEGQG